MFTARLIHPVFVAGFLFSFAIAPSAVAQTAQPSPLVEDNNAFAIDLYNRLGSAPGNVFISPYSISSCLAMTYAGARGETEAQMKKVLHFSEGQDEVHSSFAKLQIELNGAAKPGAVELDIANALWGEKSRPFLPAFLDTVSRNYSANIKQADFKHEAAAATQEINAWVAKSTQGKIQQILPPGALNSYTALVLVNAIYFKGTWLSAFNASETVPQPFHIASDKQVSAPTMHQTAGFRANTFDDCGGFAVLEMPYRGGNLSMVILLPDQIDGIDQFGKQLTPAIIDAALNQLKRRDVLVEIPKFKMESEYKLNATLAGMGMSDAFSNQKADFSGMNGRKDDLFISEVFHKAWVEVSEKGTEAAAVTGVNMAGRGGA